MHPNINGLCVNFFRLIYKLNNEIAINIHVIGTMYLDISLILIPNAPSNDVIVLIYTCVHAPPLHIIVKLDIYESKGVIKLLPKATN